MPEPGAIRLARNIGHASAHLAIAAALVLPIGLTGVARAAEPPAISPPPEPPAAEREIHPIAIEGSIQEVFSVMGEWSDGLVELEDRSRTAGSTVTTSNNPAYTTSFEGAMLFPVRGSFLVGLQYDRMTGKSEFKITENFGPGTGPGEFETEADAMSNVWLLAVRWMIPGARSGVRPLLQVAAGVGSAQLEFVTPSGGAKGKGQGFAANLEAGFLVGDGPVRVRASAGFRFHRATLSYSRVEGTSQPGVSRYYFDYDDETRDFVAGRDVDLSGAFGRLGISFAITR